MSLHFCAIQVHKMSYQYKSILKDIYITFHIHVVKSVFFHYNGYKLYILKLKNILIKAIQY